MSAKDASAAPAVVHSVYFSLVDNNPAAIDNLIAECRNFLTDHPGTLAFGCGTLSDLSRPVNDRAFDVALLVVFKDRAAHDAYQVHARHLEFISRNKPTWRQVRVFDSDVTDFAA